MTSSIRILRHALIAFAVFAASAISLQAQLTVNSDGNISINGNTTIGGNAKSSAPVAENDLATKNYVDTVAAAAGTVETGSAAIPVSGIVTGGVIYWEKLEGNKLRQFGWIAVNPADGDTTFAVTGLIWPVPPTRLDMMLVSYNGLKTAGGNITGLDDAGISLSLEGSDATRPEVGIRPDAGTTGDRKRGFGMAMRISQEAARTFSSADRFILSFSMEGQY